MEVTLCDVGPRDGLQNDEAVLAPSVRAELCERLAATGLPRVEAASFVHPKLVPQMAGAEEVLAALPRDRDVTWAALVLNRSAASAAARSPRARPATSRPRTCSTCSRARGSTPASTSTA